MHEIGYSLLFFGRGKRGRAIGFIFHLWEVVGVGVCGWMSVCGFSCLGGWVCQGVGELGTGNLELAHLKITQKWQLNNHRIKASRLLLTSHIACAELAQFTCQNGCLVLLFYGEEINQ